MLHGLLSSLRKMLIYDFFWRNFYEGWLSSQETAD